MHAPSSSQVAPPASPGYVYLLHLDPPYRAVTGKRVQVARHYLGHALDLDARLAQHRAGNGARLVAVATAAGSTFQLAATWPGTRTLERRLKRCGGRARFCSLCSSHPRRPRLEPPAAPIPDDDAPPF